MTMLFKLLPTSNNKEPMDLPYVFTFDSQHATFIGGPDIKCEDDG